MAAQQFLNYIAGEWADPARRIPQEPLGLTNYAGVGGLGGLGQHPVVQRYTGIFNNRSRISVASVTAMDGTSTTLLVGETCGMRDPVSGKPLTTPPLIKVRPPMTSDCRPSGATTVKVPPWVRAEASGLLPSLRFFS